MIEAGPPDFTKIGLPDYTGQGGSAWRAEPFAADAQLAGWLLYAPHAHRFWHWHTLTLVTLEDVPGVEPATLYTPTARFELLVLALSPEHTPASRAGPFAPLMPADVIVQFGGELDTPGAVEFAGQLVQAVAAGWLVPDSDFRLHWLDVVRARVPDAVGPPERTPR